MNFNRLDDQLQGQLHRRLNAEPHWQLTDALYRETSHLLCRLEDRLDEQLDELAEP